MGEIVVKRRDGIPVFVFVTCKWRSQAMNISRAFQTRKYRKLIDEGVGNSIITTFCQLLLRDKL